MAYQVRKRDVQRTLSLTAASMAWSASHGVVNFILGLEYLQNLDGFFRRYDRPLALRRNDVPRRVFQCIS